MRPICVVYIEDVYDDQCYIHNTQDRFVSPSMYQVIFKSSKVFMAKTCGEMHVVSFICPLVWGILLRHEFAYPIIA